MSPLAVLTKLAGMLRNVPPVQFVFAMFAALLRGNKGSGEPLIIDFLGEAPATNRNTADEDVDVSKPSSNRAIAVPETNDQSDRETLIRRRWTETGIKMWNPQRSRCRTYSAKYSRTDRVAAAEARRDAARI
jgi:hypothetical protein